MKRKFFKTQLCCGLLGILGSSMSVQAIEPDNLATKPTPEKNSVKVVIKNTSESIDNLKSKSVNNKESQEKKSEEGIRIKFSFYDLNLKPLEIKDGLKIYKQDDISGNQVKEDAIAIDIENHKDYAIANIPLTQKNSNKSLSKFLIDVKSNIKTNKIKGKQFIFPLSDYKSDITCTETRLGNNLEITMDDKELELGDYYLLSEESLDNVIIKWDILAEDQEMSEMTENGEINVTRIQSTIKENRTIDDILKSYSESITSDSSLDYTTVKSPIEDYKNLVWKESHFEADLTSGQKVSSICSGEVIEVDYENNFAIVKANDKLLVYKNIIPTCRVGPIYTENEIGIGYSGKVFQLYAIQSGTIDANLSSIINNWQEDGRYSYSNDNIRMPLYLQGSGEWSNLPYGTSTIGEASCGPCSMAMVLSQIEGKIITPPQLIEQMRTMGNGMWYYCPGAGSYHNIFPVIASHYGIQCNQIAANYDSIRAELEQGRFVIISIGAGPYYHGAGHFITLRGLSESGNFYINDSAGIYDLNTEYTWTDLGSVETARSIYEVKEITPQPEPEVIVEYPQESEISETEDESKSENDTTPENKTDESNSELINDSEEDTVSENETDSSTVTNEVSDTTLTDMEQNNISYKEDIKENLNSEEKIIIEQIIETTSSTEEGIGKREIKDDPLASIEVNSWDEKSYDIDSNLLNEILNSSIGQILEKNNKDNKGTMEIEESNIDYLNSDLNLIPPENENSFESQEGLGYTGKLLDIHNIRADTNITEC